MRDAGVAQLVEQLICNQQVGGSSPSTSSNHQFNMGEFPSGQRGQTVNLLSVTSMVRIHLPPPSVVVYLDATPKSLEKSRLFAFFTPIFQVAIS